MTRVGRSTPELIPIPQIQGRGALSAYDGDVVKTSGVVTALARSERSPGFWMQDPKGDGDAATSDGIYVDVTSLGSKFLDTLQPGRRVEVTGEVDEDNQLTTLIAEQKQAVRNLSKPSAVATLPEAVELKLPASKNTRQVYLEAREGMLTSLPNALVLTPTNRYGGYVATDESVTGLTRNRTSEPSPQHIKVSGGRSGPKPQLVTGDRLVGVHGPLGVMFGEFEIQQSRNYEAINRGPQPPKMWGDIDGDDRITPRDVNAIKGSVGQPATGPLDPADLSGDGKISRTDVNLATKRSKIATGAPSFSVATMNAKDFFDNTDAPPPIDDEVPSRNEYEAKLARISSAIKEKLGLPDMIAMQEVENTDVLDALIARPELKALGYKYALLPTEGHRSINPALLYRSDAVKVTDVRQVQKQVTTEDSPVAPQLLANEGTPDGTAPLFARQPLLVDVTVKNGDQQQELTVVVNHLISKFSPHGTPTDPIRIEQTKFLNGLIKDLRAARPERDVIVIGDMNDHPDSKAMKALKGPKSTPVLRDVMTENVPQGERYSYNWNGTNQLIDHILVNPELAERVEAAGIRHYNADLPENLSFGTGPNRATDHDTPWASFRFPAAVADAAAGAEAVQPAAR